MVYFHHVSLIYFFFYSCGFLQSNQHALRHHHGFLHRGKLSSHVCWSKVSYARCRCYFRMFCGLIQGQLDVRLLDLNVSATR